MDAAIRGVATTIAGYNDQPSMIFRRFDKLAMVNILHLHRSLSDVDSGTWTPEKEGLIKRYPMLLPSGHSFSATYLTQINANGSMCTDEAVFLYSEMLKLKRPPIGVLRDLEKMVTGANVDDVWNLSAPKRQSKKRQFHSDLVAVSDYDPLTRFFLSTVLKFLFTVSASTLSAYCAYLTHSGFNSDSKLGLDRVHEKSGCDN
jgi:hypothetical protein